MKKLTLLLAVIFLIATPHFAAATPGKIDSKNPKASELFLPIGQTGNQISLEDLSKISRKDFEKVSGHKMNAGQKMAFKIVQKKLRNMINEDGTVTNKTLLKSTAGEGFHIGGFALGFFLGLIGVLIAYLIGDDKKSKRVKWAWIGAAIGLAITLILILA